MTDSKKSSSFSFPHPELTKLTPGQQPTFTFCRTLKQEVFANAISVHTHRGGGNHGHLGEVVDGPTYIAVTGIAGGYEAPAYPGDAPEEGGTAAQVRAAEKAWEREMKEFETARDVRLSLKQLIMAALPEQFYAELKDPVFGYANVTTIALLAHVIDTYGEMKPEDHAENKKALSAPWDIKEPISILWNRAQECRAIATQGGNAISEMDTINALLKVIDTTGVFTDDCKDWRKTLPINQSMVNFKAHFNTADREYRLSLSTTKAGYHANAAQAKTPAPAPAPVPSPKANETNLYWCWSHGASWNPNHTSKTCSSPKEGHEVTATINNMMGGCCKIARKKGDKPHPTFQGQKPKGKKDGTPAEPKN